MTNEQEQKPVPAERGAPTLPSESQCDTAYNLAHGDAQAQKLSRYECEKAGIRAVRSLCLQSQPVPRGARHWCDADCEEADAEIARLQARIAELEKSQPVPTSGADDKSVETMCSLSSSLTEHVCGAMPEARRIKHYWRVECACGLETAKCSTEAMAVQVWATANPQRPASPSSFGERLTKLAEMELWHLLDKIRKHDRTPTYEYGQPLRTGEKPGPGARFLTPRELVDDALRTSQPEIRAALGRSGEPEKAATWELRRDVALAAYYGLREITSIEERAARIITLDAFKRACERLETHGAAESERRVQEIGESNRKLLDELAALKAPQRAEPGEREANVQVRPCGAGWQVWLVVGVQSFTVGACYEDDGGDTGKEQADWHASMLRKALANLPAPTAGRAETSEIESLAARFDNLARTYRNLARTYRNMGGPHSGKSERLASAEAYENAANIARARLGAPLLTVPIPAPSASGETKGEVAVAPPAPAAGDDEAGSDECDECDGFGTYYLSGKAQTCICVEERVTLDAARKRFVDAYGACASEDYAERRDAGLRSVLSMQALSLRPSASNATMEDTLESVLAALMRVAPFRDGHETGTSGLVRRADVEQVMRTLFVASNASGGMA